MPRTSSPATGGAVPPRLQQGGSQSASSVYVVFTKGGDADEVVSTKGGDAEEVVVKTLIGTYVETGSHHGHKVFKQVAEEGSEAIDVFLYFWDSRDGPEQEGWWFGNKLGGTQVWSHNSCKTGLPPASGWKIPWNGAERPGLMVVPQADLQKAEQEDKIKEMGALIGEAESAAKLSLEQAKAAAGDYSEPEGLRVAQELLQPQVPVLSEALKKLTEAQRGSTGDTLRRYTQLGNTIRVVQNSVTAEMNKLRTSKVKAEHGEQQRGLEEKDRAAFSQVLPEAISRTNAAEDAVEKATITAELITAAGDDMAEVRQAVSQTEQAAQEAQKIVGEARIFLNAKQALTRRYESEKGKQEATAQLSKLQAQLQEAQDKLSPLKGVWQDFVQRTAAQKLKQEVLEKLSPAEVDVDRAEEATALLAGDDGDNKDLLAQAEEAVNKACQGIAAVCVFMEQRKKTASGMAKEEIAQLEERTRSSQSRIQQMRSAHKEASERSASHALLEGATEKLRAVADTVAAAAEAETPFREGVEDLPLEETLEAVKACETTSTAANTAVSIARMFIATKLVEAKRFSQGPSSSVLVKLKELQAALEGHTQKLNELKQAVAERKKAATMLEAEHEVQKAEDLAKKVCEVASVFEDEEKFCSLSSQELRATSEEAAKAEQVATAALTEARKFITSRQIEAKGKEMSTEVSAELIKFQTRIRTAQAEVGKCKKLYSTVEQRVVAKRIAEEAQGKLKAAEEKVDKVAGLAQEELDSDAGSMDAWAVEQATAEAQAALKAASRFLETQARSGSAKHELEKLQPQVKAVQERLDATITSARERSEQKVVGNLIKEAKAKVAETEAAIHKVDELESQFIEESQELPATDASGALEELESAMAAAHTAVGSTKTTLAMKRVAASRLSATGTKAANEQLGKLLHKLDSAADKLAETKKRTAEQKLSTIKREAAEKVAAVEAHVAGATEATTELCTQSVGDIPPEEMKGACEKAGTTQQEAFNALTETRNLLLTRQRDAKSMVSADSPTLTEIARQLDKLADLQADLDKQKSLLRDREHKFVAQRLLKDATDMVTGVERKLESVTESATPLTGEKEDLTADYFLMQVLEALKTHMRKVSMSSKELAANLSEDGLVTEAKFVAFYQNLPELTGQEDMVLSAEQLKAAFAHLSSEGEVHEEAVVDRLLERYVCSTVVSMTEGLAVKGGKTLRKLDVGEVVQALGEPCKDASIGLMRVKCRAEKDSKEGFVTLAGNQGTVYLEPHTPFAARVKQVEHLLQDLSDSTKDVTKYLEQKAEELKAVRLGPLQETRSELLAMKQRVSKVQYSLTQLRKRTSEAERRLKQCADDERHRRQETAERKAAEALVSEAESQIAVCTSAAEKTLPVAEALASGKAAGLEEDPLKAMDTAIRNLDALLESVEKAQAKVKEHMESIKGKDKGPFSEARSALVKLKVKAGALDAQCRKHRQGLRAAQKCTIAEAHAAVISALRERFIAAGCSPEELFKKLAGEEARIPSERLREYLEEVQNENVKAGLLKVGLKRHGEGITKLTFLQMVQEYHRCVKEIAMTTAFRVKESKTVRKLAVGEVVEAMQAPQVDGATGLQRVQCRALADLKEGWVSLRGNQGTDFVEKTSKPFFCCEAEVRLHEEASSSSPEVRKIQVGEVVEVLEGPLKEPPVETQRVQGKMAKDGKVGWLTLKDIHGEMAAEPLRVLVCRTSVALTTAFDISQGRSLRKLGVGELLTVVEGPTEDKNRCLTRVKAKSKTDGKTGWVTMMGNQGTSYVEESDRHYVCKRLTRLEAKFNSGTAHVRDADEDELFELLDGPKPEIKEGANRVRGRNLSDSTEGWFTLNKHMQPWGPQYKCVQSTTLSDHLDMKEAKPVRKLEVGEPLEALEIPVLDAETGIMRVRLRADKDGAVGFAAVRGNQGTVLLKPTLGDL